MAAARSLFRNLVVICLAGGSWAVSFGLGTQVISHWLKAKGHSDTVIGLNHSVYYLGLGITAILVPWLMGQRPRGCAPTGMILSGLSLGLFPWGGPVACLFLLRFLNGVAAGLSLIPLETLISRCSSPEQKTRNFGFYAVALTLGGAAGIWAGLHYYLPGQSGAFYLGAAFPLLGGLALLRWLAWPTPETETGPGPASLQLERHFLSLGTAWSQGFLEGGLLAFMSFFLMSLGLSAEAAGRFMGIAMVGMILFQVPVSWLADRLGQVPVLLGCYAIVMAGLALLPWCLPSLWLGICLFLFAACSGALYPLGLSLLGEGMAEKNLARAYAWYMALECFGSQMGAAAMGQARDRWGEKAMFPVGLAAVLAVLLTWLILQFFSRRKSSALPVTLPVPQREQVPLSKTG